MDNLKSVFILFIEIASQPSETNKESFKVSKVKLILIMVL